MKTLNTLYKLLLDSYLTSSKDFLCNVIDLLKISPEERQLLTSHFNANKPSEKLHPEFLTDNWVGSNAWWNNFARQERTGFLTKMIELTTNPADTLAELTCQIEADNEAFKALTKAEKRVKVAHDTIARIRLGQFLPNKGHFAAILDDKFDDKPIKSILNTVVTPVCDVCAKGGLFMAYVGRVNKETFELSMDNGENNRGTKKLLEIFSIKQLALIEYAFEGDYYIYSVEFSEREEDRASNFYAKYKRSAEERLIAICGNIIRNKGTFKL